MWYTYMSTTPFPQCETFTMKRPWRSLCFYWKSFRSKLHVLQIKCIAEKSPWINLSKKEEAKEIWETFNANIRILNPEILKQLNGYQSWMAKCLSVILIKFRHTENAEKEKMCINETKVYFNNFLFFSLSFFPSPCVRRSSSHYPIINKSFQSK